MYLRGFSTNSDDVSQNKMELNSKAATVRKWDKVEILYIYI